MTIITFMSSMIETYLVTKKDIIVVCIMALIFILLVVQFINNIRRILREKREYIGGSISGF